MYFFFILRNYAIIIKPRNQNAKSLLYLCQHTVASTELRIASGRAFKLLITCCRAVKQTRRCSVRNCFIAVAIVWRRNGGLCDGELSERTYFKRASGICNDLIQRLYIWGIFLVASLLFGEIHFHEFTVMDILNR